MAPVTPPVLRLVEIYGTVFFSRILGDDIFCCSWVRLVIVWGDSPTLKTDGRPSRLPLARFPPKNWRLHGGTSGGLQSGNTNPNKNKPVSLPARLAVAATFSEQLVRFLREWLR